MQSQIESGGGCVAPPTHIFLFVTILMTIGATAMLCTAIMTNHWETIYWDRGKLEKITNSSNHLTWYLDYKIAKLDIFSKMNKHGYRKNFTIFLVPMIGGIWNLCIDLTEREMRHLGPFRHSKVAPCVNYLVNNEETLNKYPETFKENGESALGPHLRMQNLSISCALVCLIILGTASLVGAFGICQKQISAILITGVMYLLAALFALFTSMILLFKRQHGRALTDFDGVLTKDQIYFSAAIFEARVFLSSWSLDLGWCGVILCTITSILWILLSKIMRYSPALML